MTTFHKTSLSFTVILAAGIAIFTWQSQQLRQLRLEAGTGGEGAAFPSASSPGDGRKGRVVRKPTLMERVNAKLFAAVKPEEVVTFVGAGNDELARIGMAVKLSAAEQAEIKSAFADFEAERTRIWMDASLTGEARAAQLADQAGRKKAWLGQRLGAERAGVLAEAESGFDRARAGQQATRSVARVSRAVDLTAAQAEQLYAGFVEREMNPPPSPEPVLALRPFGGVTVEPAGPNIDAEAEKILTPEQWRAWMEIREAKGGASYQQTQFLMTRIMPNFLSALREVSAEE